MSSPKSRQVARVQSSPERPALAKLLACISSPKERPDNHTQARIAVIQPVSGGLAKRGHVVSLHTKVQDAQAEAKRRTDILALIAPVGPAVEVGAEVSLHEARRP